MRTPSWRTRPTNDAVNGSFMAVILLTITAFVLTGASAQAQGVVEHASEGTDGEASAEESDAGHDAQLRLGAEVYGTFCVGCHQAGGAGMTGLAPPLVDNPNIDDTAYLAGVIGNGLEGEIVVNGETYNGVMPSFSTLGADELDALVEYIQSGFAAPAANEQAFEDAKGPVAGTALPGFTNVGFLVVVVISLGLGVGVFAPRLVSANSRLEVPWVDAWLKTFVIVVASILLVVIVPNWALQHEVVAKLSRPAQDLIGVGLWGTGLAVLLGGLWYAHRESRI